MKKLDDKDYPQQIGKFKSIMKKFTKQKSRKTIAHLNDDR